MSRSVERRLILMSNDDGYSAVGLQLLSRELKNVADVVVCAPETEQSGTSHSITLNRPLRLRERGDGMFSVDGTPADCIYVALHAEGRVLPRWPDLVVSGLNDGLNLGNDVFYSGTVAAAREAALKGIPGLAVSAARDADVQAAVQASARLAEALLSMRVKGAKLFNANFPKGKGWPVVATRLGTRRYADGVHFRQDPRGGEYLWIGSGDVQHDELEGSDTAAFDAGIVGITPLGLELWAGDQAALAERLAAQMKELV